MRARIRFRRVPTRVNTASGSAPMTMACSTTSVTLDHTGTTARTNLTGCLTPARVSPYLHGNVPGSGPVGAETEAGSAGFSGSARADHSHRRSITGKLGRRWKPSYHLSQADTRHCLRALSCNSSTEERRLWPVLQLRANHAGANKGTLSTVPRALAGRGVSRSPLAAFSLERDYRGRESRQVRWNSRVSPALGRPCVFCVRWSGHSHPAVATETCPLTWPTEFLPIIPSRNTRWVQTMCAPRTALR
jgi:hypothetical protein